MRTKTIELVDEFGDGLFLRNGEPTNSNQYVSICRDSLEDILPETKGCKRLFVKGFTYEPDWHTVKFTYFNGLLMVDGSYCNMVEKVHHRLINMIGRSKTNTVYVQVWYE